MAEDPPKGGAVVTPPQGGAVVTSPKDGGGDRFGAVLRETVTAGISLIILGITTFFMVDTYCTGKKIITGATEQEIKAKTEAYTRQKDLLLYGLALLGTVTGYYLGRVPAELHANSAQQNANTARSEAKQAQASEANTKAMVRSDLVRVKDMIAQNVTGGARDQNAGGTRDFEDPAQKAINDLLAKL